MKTLTLLVTFMISLAGCSSADQRTAGASDTAVADAVYTNGKIYTVDESRPWAEAVALKDGAFVAVGTNADVKAMIGSETTVVDLGGKFVMPGFHDIHVHVEQAYIADMLGDAMMNFPPEESSIEALQALLKMHSDKNPDLPVLFAGGLEISLFPNSSPTKAFIDDVVPDRPVVLLSATEHEGLLNSKAMEMEGFTADTESPKGGTVVKDPDTGEPTGLLKETAAGKWAWKHFPVISGEQNKQGLQGTIAYLNSVGITSIKQQHAKNPIAFAAQGLEKDGNLNARIALSWTYKGPLEPMPLDEQETMIAERGQFASDLIKTEFVKLSIDGNAGSTGYVDEPYLITGDYGLPVWNDDDLFAEVEKFDRMGLGITGHATGDAANRQVIDAVAYVKEKHGEVKGRHQLGHATMIHPEDIPRLKELDVTPEFSPVFWYPSGFPDAQKAQLGDDRMSGWYPINSVAQSGGRVTLASDGPLYWHGPLLIMETAITRKAPGGVGEALNPHEGIDLATAIKAVTLNSAYLMNQEDRVGSIEVGKRADMVVLDNNLFEIPVTEIGKSSVQMTVFDGEVVYDATLDATGEEAIEEEYGVDLDLEGDPGYHGSFKD
jgi:predicted amidohydrolase YtcJ